MAIGKWDKRFIGLALHVAEWSKDPSTRVGAVIVDNKQRVISMGYNGPPRGVSDHYVTREDKLFKTIHAEENAVLFAKQDLTGATVYVTHPPCANCAAKLVQSGVSRVVFPSPSEDFLSRWKESYYAALGMFVEAGVTVETGE